MFLASVVLGVALAVTYFFLFSLLSMGAIADEQAELLYIDLCVKSRSYG